MLTEQEQFEFFWEGPFSQWHKCNFEVRGVSYNCAEQFMMAQKALLFGDEATFQKIMASTSPREQKKLGRKVSNFDKAIWDQNRYTIVLAANVAKFTDNEYLKELLMETELKTLVEASPYDKIWGIGLAEYTKSGEPVDAVNYREEWKGINLLGQSLTQVREFFKLEEFTKTGFSPKL
jgi:ribA/ribD-fused uncharacterized protein